MEKNLPAIEMKNLCITHGNREIIKNVSFSASKSSITSIVGPSGAGKTTLLRCMNRLLEEDAGYTIKGDIIVQQSSIFGSNLNKYDLRRQVGMIFQKPTIFPTSIFKNVIFGAKHSRPLPRNQYKELAESCLKDAFLWDEVKGRLDDKALNLSIGQQQRLAISRTLALAPEIILMDEPTSSLDVHATSKIEHLVLKLKETKTIIIVTHHIKQALAISDQIINIVPGEHGSTAEIFSNKDDFKTLQKQFTSEVANEAI